MLIHYINTVVKIVRQALREKGILKLIRKEKKDITINKEDFQLTIILIVISALECILLMIVIMDFVLSYVIENTGNFIRQ